MITETKWLKFIEKEDEPKTKVFSVMSKHSNCELGEIKWYSQWRHYCFSSRTDVQIIYSDRCLAEISGFITILNSEHKKFTPKEAQK